VQPQAHVFWPLLTGEATLVVQEARQREVDTQIYKYAGVAGVDKPRIVQVGYHAAFLENLRQQVGLNRLVSELIGDGNITAIRIVDGTVSTLAYSAVQGFDLGQLVNETEAVRLREVVEQGQPASYLDGSVLKVIAPVTKAGEQVIGATLVILPTDHVRATIRDQLTRAAIVAAFVLAIGLLTSVILSRRVTEPVAQITAAAAAIEAGAFDPEKLSGVAGRADELGQLARVFQRMAREVHAREERLKRQIETLRIEVDERSKVQQVAEITETDYFRELQRKVKDMKSRQK
jgi:methyl-accepting chemotaxis protein